MASNGSTSQARTAPKGKATRSRSEARRGGSLLTPTMQWILAAIAVLLVLGAVFYLGRDVRSTNQGGTAPADVLIDVAAREAGAA